MVHNIKCPQCGSTQIYTNKRGWSLLTGMIGMNKIVLTCIKCGYQFRPGQDLDSIKISELDKKDTRKGSLVLLGIILVLALVVGFFAVQEKATSKTEEKKEIEQITNSDLDQFYIIEKADTNRPTIKNLSLFIKDTTKIGVVNEYLIKKYNPNKDNNMSIFYFTKKGIGKTYMEKQNDEKVSENEKNMLFKYLIFYYSYNASNNHENLNYNHK